MYATPNADRFEIINGPEDGTEFPLTRSPFELGADPGCAVHSRLDEDVKLYHARASVVSKGYCIRSLAGAQVWVNGKRAGRIRSRVARAKDVVRIGRTEFVVHLAEGGLASRSYGMRMESDLTYALRSSARGARKLLGSMGGLLSHGKIRVLVLVAIITATACYLSPTFRYNFFTYAYWARDWIIYGFQWSMFQLGLG